MPTLTQVVLDALQIGADPVAALQDYVNDKDDLYVPRAWCARYVQNIVSARQLAQQPPKLVATEDGHLESDYEDRVSGTDG